MRLNRAHQIVKTWSHPTRGEFWLVKDLLSGAHRIEHGARVSPWFGGPNLPNVLKAKPWLMMKEELHDDDPQVPRLRV